VNHTSDVLPLEKYGTWKFCPASQGDFRYLYRDDTPSVSVSSQISTSYYESITFSGAYTYFVPFGDSPAENFSRVLSLLDKQGGVSATPDVIWNLIPWSWLSDWIVDIGSSIAAASAFQKDDLVLKWGYLQRKVVAERTYTSTASVGFKSIRAGTVTTTLRTTSKERVRILPYGPALSPNQFTGQQWAVLTALGMTQGDKQLRFIR
jgi:hypothetical protein